MQARMMNPAIVLPDALQALTALNKATERDGLPARTRLLVQLRASQINGCSVCVDMHSRELKSGRARPDQRIFAVGSLAGRLRTSTAAERAALALAETVTRLSRPARTRCPTRSGTRRPGTTTSPSLAALVLSDRADQRLEPAECVPCGRWPGARLGLTRGSARGPERFQAAADRAAEAVEAEAGADRPGARTFGLEQGDGVGLEHEAGEPAGPHRPGVDGDAVRVVLDHRHDGVAVHDLEAEVGGRAQERLANPDQVVAILRLERDARADAGVHEQVAADAQRQRAGVEEIQVLRREGHDERAVGRRRLQRVGAGTP